MSDPVISVTRRLPPELEREIRREFPSARLSIDDRPLGRDGLEHLLDYADVILPTVTDAFPADLLHRGVRTRLLANFGVGVDHIDLDAARQAGVTVTNTPGVLTDSTADHAVMLMLMAARRAGEGEREVRSGGWTGWRPTHLLGRDLRGRTLGIVGMGRIGCAVARRAADGLGMRVVWVGRDSGESSPAGIEARCTSSLDELLGEADVVSLHAPGSEQNRHLIDHRRLELMRPSAILVNTARGDLVDTAALVDVLKRERIAGAGLDVYEGEPSVAPELLELENVVLLPHLGSATYETRLAMGRLALENIRAFLDGAELPSPVIECAAD